MQTVLIVDDDPAIGDLEEEVLGRASPCVCVITRPLRSRRCIPMADCGSIPHLTRYARRARRSRSRGRNTPYSSCSYKIRVRSLPNRCFSTLSLIHI